MQMPHISSCQLTSWRPLIKRELRIVRWLRNTYLTRPDSCFCRFVGEDEVCEGEQDGVTDTSDPCVWLPMDGGVGQSGDLVGDAVHRVGCPVEQVGEDAVDGFAPKEEPPEDAAQHQEIDERKDGKVAGDGE